MYKLFLTLRYLRKRRIAFFAIGAVTLCVAMVLIVLSVMGGWLEQVMQRSRGLLGDIIVDNHTNSGFPLYDEFITEIEKWPEVVKATPVLYSYGLFQIGKTYNGTVRIVGIRLEEVFEVNAFKASLFYEKFYPGTTRFGDQQQAVLGFDPDAPPVKSPEGDEFMMRELPEPYRSALSHADQVHREQTGQPLTDTDSVPDLVDDSRTHYGQPPIPGLFELAEMRNPPGYEGDTLPGVILGRDLIAERQRDGRYERFIPLGEVVRLTMVPITEVGNVDPTPIKRQFRYADDSRTGIYEIDSQHVYVDFGLMQQLLLMDEGKGVDGDVIPARCSQIQIKTIDGADTEALAQRMEDLYLSYLEDPKRELRPIDRDLIARVQAVTWQRQQAHIIGPVQKEKALMTILFGIISLVAVALVLCILYMIVLQKTRDIGIIKAIGGSSVGVAAVWVLYGLAVGVVGCALGSAFGVWFVSNINEIQDALIAINPAWRVWDMQVYSFDRIPSRVATSDLIGVNAIGVLAATVGSVAAAWRAGRMQPVEALRDE
ncbi:MAG: ABC transporter permease [Phycisphaerales bacterium]|nr:ABC transporter permease [Phycisphaerales bacterium]